MDALFCTHSSRLKEAQSAKSAALSTHKGSRAQKDPEACLSSVLWLGVQADQGQAAILLAVLTTVACNAKQST